MWTTIKLFWYESQLNNRITNSTASISPHHVHISPHQVLSGAASDSERLESNELKTEYTSRSPPVFKSVSVFFYMFIIKWIIKLNWKCLYFVREINSANQFFSLEWKLNWHCYCTLFAFYNKKRLHLHIAFCTSFAPYFLLFQL